MADWGLKIGIDGEVEFQKAVQSINSNIRLLNSELALSTSKFNANDIELGQLSDAYKGGRVHVADLLSVIDDIKKALSEHEITSEKDAQAVQRWTTQLNKAEKQMTDLQAPTDETANLLKKVQQELDVDIDVSALVDVKKSFMEMLPHINNASSSIDKFNIYGDDLKNLGGNVSGVLKGMNIDFGDFKGIANIATTAVKNCASAVKNWIPNLIESKKATAELKDTQMILSSNLNVLARGVEIYRKDLEKSIATTGEDSKETKELRAELEKMENNFKSTQNELEDVNKALNKTSDELDETGDSAKEMGDETEKGSTKVAKGISDVAKQVAGNLITDGFRAIGNACKDMVSAVVDGFKAVGSAIADGAKAAIDAGREYESAFASVRKTVNGTDEELATLSDEIMELSRTIPMSSAELAELAGVAGQMGIDTDKISGFTEVIAQLGVATNLSAEDAALAMSKFSTVIGMSQDDFDKFGSSIVALGNNYPTMESDILAISQRLAGAGKQANLSAADIAGISAAISSVGIEAEMGGSAVSKLLLGMTGAIETGTGKIGGATINLDQFAELAGMSADEFKKSWDTDAAGAFQKFLGGIDESESSVQILSELGIEEVRLRDTMLRLSEASDMMGETIEMSNSAWEENTALSTEAERRYETFDSQLEIAKNSAKEFGIELYNANLKIGDSTISVNEGLGALVGTGTGFMTSLTDAFRAGASESGSFSDGVKAMADKVIEIVQTIVTDLPKIISNLIPEMVTSITTIVDTVSDNAPLLIDTVLGVIQTLVDSLSGNAVKMAEIAGTLILAFIDGALELLPMIAKMAVKLLETITTGLVSRIPDFIDSIDGTIMVVIKAIVDALPTILQAVMDILFGVMQSLTNTLPTLIPDLISAVLQLINSLVDFVLTNIPLLIDAAVQLVLALADGILKSLPLIIKAATDLVLTLIEFLVTPGGLAMIINAAVQLVLALVGGIVDALPLIISAVADMLSLIVGTLLSPEGLKSLFKVGIEIIKGIVKGLWDGVKSLLKAVGDIVKALLKGFKDLLGIHSPSKVFADIGDNLIQGLIDGISSLASKVVELIGTIAKGIIDGITAFFSKAAEIGTALIQGIIDGVTAMSEAILTLITTLSGGIIDGITTFFSKAGEIGTALIQGLIDGINSIAEQLSNLATAVADVVIELITTGFSQITRVGKELINNLISAINSVTGGLFSKATEFATTVINNVISVFEKIFDVGKNLINNLSTGVWNTVTTIYTTITDVAQNIINKATEKLEYFREIGSNLVKGLWNGIQDVSDWLWNKISGFFSSITDRIKDFFGIASPSKLFRDEIGMNLVKGIGLGFDKGTDGAISDIMSDMNAINRSVVDNLPDGYDVPINVSGALSSVNALSKLPTHGVSIDTSLSMPILADKIDKMTKILSSILAKNPNIILDSGVLIGSIAPQMDNKIGSLALMKGR